MAYIDWSPNIIEQAQAEPCFREGKALIVLSRK